MIGWVLLSLVFYFAYSHRHSILAEPTRSLGVKAVVAYRGGDDGTEALALAATLRRTTDAELTVVAVLPPVSDHPGIARVDLEYRDWVDTVAAEAEGRAASVLSPDNPDGAGLPAGRVRLGRRRPRAGRRVACRRTCWSWARPARPPRARG